MKKLLRRWAAAAVGAVVVSAFASCAYDPYYNTSVGGSYGSGYGQGYGYGGSGFSTSVFVGTGDPRWGYDPYCYSYYDYHRRCYYDPYLHGYYPIGYRPPVIVGCPHPYGWRPGRGYCPPPTYVKNVTVVNYHNREAAYRNSNYGWARQVRQQQPAARGRSMNQTPDRYPYNRPNTGSPPRASQERYGRNDNTSRPSAGTYSRQNQERRNYSQQVKPTLRGQQGSRLPSTYNTPVTSPPQRQVKSGQRGPKIQSQPRPSPQPGYQRGKQPKQPSYNRGNPNRKPESRPAAEEGPPIRGLGQG